MNNLSRRAVLKGLAGVTLLPVFLNAKSDTDIKDASGKYELTKAKNGRFVVKSDKEAVQFRVGSSALMLRAKSEVGYETNGVGIKTLELIGGGVMAVFGEGQKKLITKTATIGIRGTGIYVEEHSCDQNYICLCYGKADYMAPNGKVFESLVSKHHDKPLLVTADKYGDVKFEVNKTQNHTDDELRTLEKMCHRTMP